jgi:hypothetical protein
MFKKNRSNLKLINIWVIAGAMIVALALTIVLLMLLNATRGQKQTGAPATALLNVIEVTVSTDTPIMPTSTPAETLSSEFPPSPQPGELAVGNSVQISGTGGDGLRLRSSPGLEGEVLFLAYEGEVFQVLDGPQEVDGYIWWYLSAPYDEKVKGWAVSNFVMVLQIP